MTKIKMLKNALGDKFSYYIRWNELSEKVQTIEFIREFKNYLNWNILSRSQKFQEEDIEEFKDEVNWEYISSNQVLSESFIRKHKDNVHWYNICLYQKLSEPFISEFESLVYWNVLALSKSFSEEFIIEYMDKFDMNIISESQKLSENFIARYKDSVNWFGISLKQNLSQSFIREFKDYVNWKQISLHQKLDEDFIREFKDYVDWDYITIKQKLSEEFIMEFKKEMNLYRRINFIMKYHKLSKKFMKEIGVEPIKDNWLYVNKKYKKQRVLDSGLYECHEDYFIAYKSVRENRYSHFNFQYQYLKGETYEAHCDCTSEENSFGLSAWIKEEAERFKDNNNIVIEVKIKYEDVGFVTRYNKIRCFKFEVLS